MKYVLGVGLIVQKYKKDPKIRIFVDNLLIDEFDAENCEPTNKTMQYHHKQYAMLPRLYHPYSQLFQYP